MFLAYNFHFNLFPIYDSLANPSDKKMFKCAVISETITTIIYITSGIVGYLSYGICTNGNFLKSINYSDINSGLYYLIFISYAIHCTFGIIFIL